jgi:hypothetical protein
MSSCTKPGGEDKPKTTEAMYGGVGADPENNCGEFIEGGASVIGELGTKSVTVIMAKHGKSVAHSLVRGSRRRRGGKQQGQSSLFSK